VIEGLVTVSLTDQTSFHFLGRRGEPARKPKVVNFGYGWKPFHFPAYASSEGKSKKLAIKH